MRTQAREPGFSLLSRAFLALAVIFATIAIPFALDDRYTAAVWAVEAAGVYWIGVRQNVLFARAFALVVEVGAAVAFVLSGFSGADDAMFGNAHFVGRDADRPLGPRDGLRRRARGEPLASRRTRAARPGVRLGCAVVACRRRIELVATSAALEESHAVLAWVTASVALALLSSRWLKWPRLATAGIVRIAAAMLVAAYFDFHLARARRSPPMAGSCGRALARALVGARGARSISLAARDPKYAAVDVAEPAELRRTRSRRGLYRADRVGGERMDRAVDEPARPHGRHAPRRCLRSPICGSSCISGTARAGRSLRIAARYTVGAGAPLAVLVALWFFTVNALSPGDVSPLPYVPLGNPLDATLALALWATAGVGRHFAALPERALYRWLAAGLFVVLNGVLLRHRASWGARAVAAVVDARVEAAAGGAHAARGR
jgi:hypothetical protein